MSCLAVSHHARRNRRLAAILATGMQFFSPRLPCPEVTAADLVIPASPRRGRRRRPGRPIRCAAIMLAVRGRPGRRPSKIFVQLHDIK